MAREREPERSDTGDPAAPTDTDTDWWVYVLCSAAGDRTYVGVALDVERRLAQHNGQQPGGAKATRGHRPWRVARTFGPFSARGEAQRAEAELKRKRHRDRLGE